MALVQFDFYSQVIGVETSLNLILPQSKEDPEEEDFSRENKNFSAEKFSTLYLLHGLSDDHTAWVRKTSIERYANKHNLAVVMPVVHRSFYTDMVYGYPYWTFVSEELPRIVRHYFPLSDKREDNFVAGLSMGGFGAFKLALNCPDKFSAAASLSGALDIVREAKEEEKQEEWSFVFGDLKSLRGSKNDLCFLAKNIDSSRNSVPKLFQACGMDDFLYQDNLKFKKMALANNLDLTYEEDPGEEHTWSYWDKKIQRVLDWLPLKE